MIIRMYHSDHNPPHFHVQYGEIEAQVEIKTGKYLNGQLPNRLAHALEIWRKLHRLELANAWKQAIALKTIQRIKPLE